MIKETNKTGEKTMAIDHWFLDFTRRAAPPLRHLMQSSGELPPTLADALERLRQTERNDGRKTVGKSAR